MPYSESGLEALTNAMRESRTAYDAAQRVEDATERRRAVAVASREMRYFADRLRTAQVVAPPSDFGAVAFGHRVTFRRGDGRRQAFRIVGEDEADPGIAPNLCSWPFLPVRAVPCFLRIFQLSCLPLCAVVRHKPRRSVGPSVGREAWGG